MCNISWLIYPSAPKSTTQSYLPLLCSKLSIFHWRRKQHDNSTQRILFIFPNSVDLLQFIFDPKTPFEKWTVFSTVLDSINWKPASLFHASIPFLVRKLVVQRHIAGPIPEDDSIEVRELTLSWKGRWGGMFPSLARVGCIKLCLVVDSLNRVRVTATEQSWSSCSESRAVCLAMQGILPSPNRHPPSEHPGNEWSRLLGLFYYSTRSCSPDQVLVFSSSCKVDWY